MSAFRSRIRRWLLPLVLFAGGLLLGAVVRFAPAPPGDGPPPTASPRREVSQAVFRAPSSRSTVPPYRSAADAAADERPGHFTRFVHWLLAAEEPDVTNAWQRMGTAWLEKKQNRFEDQPKLELLLIRWAELAPHAMLAALDGHAEAFTAWAQVDLDAAITAALEAIRGGSKTAYQIIYTVALLDPARARALLEEHPDEFGKSSQRVLAAADARDNPRAVFDRPDSHYSTPRLGLVEWAAAEPEAALQWALANVTSYGTNRSVKGESNFKAAVSGIIEADKHDVLALSRSLPAGKLRSDLLEKYVQRLATRDPERAIAIAREQGGSHLRRSLLSSIGQILASQDPARSLDLLRGLIAEGPHAVTHPPDVLLPDGTETKYEWTLSYLWTYSLAPEAPHETMALVSDLPGSTGKYGPGTRLAEQWIAHDEPAFSQWLESRPAGPQRDPYIAQLVRNLTGWHNSDLPSAVTWANRLTDEGGRNEYLRHTIDVWLQRHRAGADTWFASDDVPEAARRIYEELAEGGAP